jgi:mevalonate kinase
MIREYYASGKLMISGEYLVLKGASALVVPLKVGMHMKVTDTAENGYPMIRWHAKVLKEPWFSADIDIGKQEIKQTTDFEIASRLLQLLKEAGRLNSLLFSHGGFDIETENGFNIHWGFGSSSALVANIAQWAVIDPFDLHFRTSEGSGADIAASVSTGPVIYRLVKGKPVYCRVDFAPDFNSHLWLVYLGRKQDTPQSVAVFKNEQQVTRQQIGKVDKLTHLLINARHLDEFIQLIRELEEIMSQILGVTRVKEMLFNDFDGEIKSLGAWGGDFVMAASQNEGTAIKAYFEKKGLYPVFSINEIVL